ncbi:MAG: YigZ family protein [Actinomycetia bacterium]|nr:YigZ family protein [Actinomycetes bacterium]
MHEPTLIVEKKSRFLAYSKRVTNEGEAMGFIAEISREHKKAKHVVYAYVLESTERCSDAGEPRGTAGPGLVAAIKRRGLVGIAVVVVRYFGGILLGKGGLLRAYGKAAGRSLDELLSNR